MIHRTPESPGSVACPPRRGVRRRAGRRAAGRRSAASAARSISVTRSVAVDLVTTEARSESSDAGQELGGGGAGGLGQVGQIDGRRARSWRAGRGVGGGSSRPILARGHDRPVPYGRGHSRSARRGHARAGARGVRPSRRPRGLVRGHAWPAGPTRAPTCGWSCAPGATRAPATASVDPEALVVDAGRRGRRSRGGARTGRPREPRPGRR